MRELARRVFTGIVGVLLLLFVLNKGGILLSTSIFLISLIGILEFYNALKSWNKKPIYTIGVLSTIAIYISTLTSIIYIDLIFTILLIVLLVIFLFSNKYRLEDVSLTILSIIYIPFQLFHIYYLEGTHYIWLVFLIAFGTDTFAYLIGNLFGKHKLYEKVSPNKSIEGAIGGIIGSIILVVIFSHVFKLYPLPLLIIMAFVGSIFSQIGDLVASKVKRIANIKDYGKIVFGHGGILDRFDSIIFAAPVIYYFVELFL